MVSKWNERLDSEELESKVRENRCRPEVGYVVLTKYEWRLYTELGSLGHGTMINTKVEDPERRWREKFRGVVFRKKQSQTRCTPRASIRTHWRMVCIISLYKTGKTLKRQGTLHGHTYELGVIHHNRESGRMYSAGIDIGVHILG